MYVKQSFVCIKQNNLRSVVWGEAAAQGMFLASIQWSQLVVCIVFHVFKYGHSSYILILRTSVGLHLTLLVISKKIPQFSQALKHWQNQENSLAFGGLMYLKKIDYIYKLLIVAHCPDLALSLRFVTFSQACVQRSNILVSESSNC